MIRREAIEFIAKKVNNSPIVSANGFISRDLFETVDKPSNFYMIGSMGLSSSIGLGVALKNPKKYVYVFDGDGNILMNLGSLTTIGLLQPKNLIHIIFDNGLHESTGGQPTNTKKIELKKMAKATNYRVFKAKSKEHILRILKRVDKISKPIMLIVDVEKSSLKSKRVSLPTTKIKKRFMKSLKN
tara:strand:+ start:434 stop:988 length:555 start_codon:yes stop_codon:yes gene_type:complete